MAHIQEFATLWGMLADVTLNQGSQDTITWKFTNSGEYSASSAYMVQFVGLSFCPMNATIWKMWAPSKCNFFAWLIFQNRVWTANRLLRRGLPSCNLCPLCKQVQESATHLLFQCRFTVRIWTEICTWLGILDSSPMIWRHEDSVKDWWLKAVSGGGDHRKATASLMILVSWEI